MACGFVDCDPCFINCFVRDDGGWWGETKTQLEHANLVTARLLHGEEQPDIILE